MSIFATSSIKLTFEVYLLPVSILHSTNRYWYQSIRDSYLSGFSPVTFKSCTLLLLERERLRRSQLYTSEFTMSNSLRSMNTSWHVISINGSASVAICTLFGLGIGLLLSNTPTLYYCFDSVKIHLLDKLS